MDRAIRLEKVHNARELGGLPAAGGRRVAPGRLFRSGSLHEMTEADRATLEGLGVRIVVDLRSRFEQQRQSYRWPAGRKVAAPLAADGMVSEIFARFAAGTLSAREVENWWDLTGVYDLPEEHRESLQVVFRTLLEAGPGEGVLLHCSGGKDRAGVAAALVLVALGVEWEAILEDFLATNLEARERAVEFAAWIRQATGREMSPEAAYWLAGVKGEWLEGFFRRLAERYGSVDAYLRDRLGMGPVELGALRSSYLTPPPG